MTIALEWTGTLLGLIATHGRWARYGWVAFLAANVAMGGFALAIEPRGLLLHQMGFMGSGVLGLRRTWRAPMRPHVALPCPCGNGQASHHGP